MYRLLTVLSVALLTETHGRPVEEKLAVATNDYPQYAFNYAVKDPHSRDSKAQWEERDGDVVKGAYSVREPDGSLRVVEYTASDAVGFNAVVKNVGPNVHPITVTAKAVAPVVAAEEPLLINVPEEPIIQQIREPIIQQIREPIIQPLRAPIHTPIIQPIHTPLIQPIYGIPPPLTINIPRSTVLGKSSLPWDPVSGSYGGWVPLPSGPSELRAYVISKKLVDGHLRKLVIGPIKLSGKTLVVRTKN